MKRLIKILKYRLAIRFKFCKHHILSKEEKERFELAQLRANFMFFGHDLSDMTDEEIKEGVKNVAKAFSNFGFETKEAAKAIEVMRKTS